MRLVAIPLHEGAAWLTFAALPVLSTMVQIASWPLKPHVLSSQQDPAGFAETPCFFCWQTVGTCCLCAHCALLCLGIRLAAFSTLAHSIARNAAHSKAYRTGSRCQAATINSVDGTHPDGPWPTQTGTVSAGVCAWCPRPHNSIQSCALKHKKYQSHDEALLLPVVWSSKSAR